MSYQNRSPQNARKYGRPPAQFAMPSDMFPTANGKLSRGALERSLEVMRLMEEKLGMEQLLIFRHQMAAGERTLNGFAMPLEIRQAMMRQRCLNADGQVKDWFSKAIQGLINSQGQWDETLVDNLDSPQIRGA